MKVRAPGKSIARAIIGLSMWLAALSGYGRVEAASPPGTGDPSSSRAQAFETIIPGHSTKTEVRSLLGAPWRELQFNDCGMAMDGQADETWEYRGSDTVGEYRLHIEFDDNGIVHLIAKVPDNAPAGEATAARAAPASHLDGM